jgi:hypothetical protein
VAPPEGRTMGIVRILARLARSALLIFKQQELNLNNYLESCKIGMISK